jgi:hypothetical protein
VQEVPPLKPQLQHRARTFSCDSHNVALLARCVQQRLQRLVPRKRLAWLCLVMARANTGWEVHPARRTWWPGVVCRTDMLMECEDQLYASRSAHPA